MAESTIPSPPQLALALAIVKQKPLGTTMRDYFVQIRQFIKPVTATDRSASRDQFFDSVAFWQQAYERSEAEQSKLLDRIYELEQHNEVLSTKLQSLDAARSDGIQEPIKRKAISDSNSRKKPRTQAQSQSRTSMLNECTSGGLDAQMPGFVEERGLIAAPASFMRRFYTLQKTLQGSTNPPVIALAATELCYVAVDNLLCAVRRADPGAGEKGTPLVNSPSVSATIHSIYSAYQVLLRAIKKVPSTESTLQSRGQIILHTVRLFETVIKALGIYCRNQSRQTVAEKARPVAKSKRLKTGQLDNNSRSIAEDKAVTLMSLLLCRMALSLDKTDIKTSDLQDGFSYLLLNRVGELLCLFVFKDLQLRPDLQVDNAQLSLPPGMKDMQLDEESILAAETEAKALIPPLERMLAVLDLSSSSPASDPAARTKGLLQNTLLQAVFGKSPSSWAALSPLYRDDDPMTSVLNAVQAPKHSVSDWFVQETWRLLGWELIAGSPLDAPFPDLDYMAL
ncbi:uncharacterized protein BP01DRAFT_344147 [Aspergillus saccharolyticus JOP 1030-1]|uniref:Uncharacterized protein n=1 Tax=Aspergillus saccharolyticus JOP 1030-1 TaxID=1450539 RepID=A0A319AA59_9EURO|nr:hypothetical protein BP01DRAFT_344147 [Aspergillus saccharolyticus JOP 1030-1]PYH43862.1 hypothetical protein BP01DRAFT_344147 [Aspergillus saccharolyticus JOP 1030-1]